MYPFGQEDGAEAALAQLFDDLVLVEVIVVVLMIKYILSFETQTGASERGRGRFGLEKGASHGATIPLLD